MNTNQDNKWHSLLALSAPTFTGEDTLPFGLMTALVSRLRAEEMQEQQIGRMCWRAIFASLAALVVSIGVTISVHHHLNRGNDLEPGMGGLIQVENVSAS